MRSSEKPAVFCNSIQFSKSRSVLIRLLKQIFQGELNYFQFLFECHLKKNFSIKLEELTNLLKPCAWFENFRKKILEKFLTFTIYQSTNPHQKILFFNAQELSILII